MFTVRRLIWMVSLFGCGCVARHEDALIRAAKAGNPKMLESLLSQGANPNQRDGRGLTALILAARTGNVAAVQVLLEHDADPNRSGGVNGWTPLMHAIHKNQVEVSRALLSGGADVNARGRSGETALMMAAGYGYTPIVELLMDRGADPRIQTLDGATAFAAAVGGVPDIDRFTMGGCQVSTVSAMKRRYPDLRLPDNLWGRTAKLSAIVAKLRGCPY